MERKQNIKRFLMYGLVLIGVLFVAMVSYFFARNDEVIALSVDEGTIIHANKGDTFALPISHKDKDKDTKIEVESSDPEVLSFSKATNLFYAEKGGIASITITTTNKDFGPFRFDVLVGDGTTSNPYFVSTAKQISMIGKSESWSLSECYEMINDIDLSSLYTETYFEPIGSSLTPFLGTFNGNGHSILNLKVKENYNEAGLFGVIGEIGKVENIKVMNAEIQGAFNYAGIISGINYGFIGRAEVSGNLTQNDQTFESVAGGIVGYNAFKQAQANISMCSAKVMLNSFKTMGGLVGINEASVIFNSYATVQNFDVLFSGVDASDYLAGGITGKNIANNFTTDSENIYARSVVKNCYVILENANSEKLTFGSVAGQNIDIENEYFEENKYVSVYCYSSFDSSLINNGKSSILESEIKSHSKEQLQIQENFVGWDFNTIWKMNPYPVLNCESSYEPLNVITPGSVITTKQAVIEAIQKMIEKPGSPLTYTIDIEEPVVIDCVTDLGKENWVPIGTEQVPFRGSLIVDEDSDLTITNCTISNYEYSGFFGYISNPNSVISNIKFTNFKIANTTNEFSFAGVVCGVQVDGIIENCYVDNAQIKDSARAGFIVGMASGTVKNCHAGTCDIINKCSIINTLRQGEVCYGGIVGDSRANINDCTVDYCELNNEIESNKTTYMGGIVGKQISEAISTISNCYNKGLMITNNDPNGIIGGVAGSLTGKGIVELSYNMGKGVVSTAGSSLAGGVVGYVGSDALVTKSFSKTPEYKGRLVGAIIGDNYGVLTESYAEGEYKGYHIGGIAYKNNGDILNCYTSASVIGLSKSSNYYAAGLVAILPKGGNVKYCFSNASISGSCSLFAETSARIRYAGFVNWIEVNYVGPITNLEAYEPGDLSNCVVINYGSAKVQKKFLQIFGSSSWIKCTPDDCKGLTTNDPFATFKTNNVGVWTFNANEYPTLTNVVKEVVPQE